MDFTLLAFEKFINSLRDGGFQFIGFRNFISSNTNDKIIILRHDVDKIPQNSLRLAEYEFKNAIKGSYYFRIVPSAYNEIIIKKIANLGHEIGYQYEDVDLVRKRQRLKVKNQKDEEALIDLAYESFCMNLKRIRKLHFIETICAHGSPLSPYNNKIMWKKYDYKKLGIIGDTGSDIDWSRFAYFTDTGRRWNGHKVNVRDKVNSYYISNFRTTFDMINNIYKLPSQLMITIHPQRWNDNILRWSLELISQSSKNIIKKYFFVKNQD